jgi:hypothetical protein
VGAPTSSILAETYTQQMEHTQIYPILIKQQKKIKGITSAQVKTTPYAAYGNNGQARSKIADKT